MRTFSRAFDCNAHILSSINLVNVVSLRRLMDRLEARLMRHLQAGKKWPPGFLSKHITQDIVILGSKIILCILGMMIQ